MIDYIKGKSLSKIWTNIKNYVTAKVSSKAEDDEVVKLTGNQSVSGQKTFKSNVIVENTNPLFLIKNSNVNKGTNPTTNVYSGLWLNDKNGIESKNRVAGIGCEINTAGRYRSYLCVYKPNENDTTYSQISISYSSDGTIATSAPTPPINDNSTQIATTSFVNTAIKNQVSELVNSAPETLDTLNELATALGNDPNFATTFANQISSKANDSTVVHRTGNETINGVKSFAQGIIIKKSDIDLAITPTSNKYSTYLFTDKNDNSLGVVQYAQRTTDVNDLDLYVFDKNSTAHGIQITTNNEVLPIGNNYSLGSSGRKWANVYATTFNGNLKGNADTATKASCLDNYSNVGGNKIYLDWDNQVDNYVGLKVDNTVMGGLITTKNIGSQAANSATYATTQATSDNSTKIATTEWVRALLAEKGIL